MNKTILIFAAAFPPENSSGSLRPAMFAKYLKRNGWNPIVVRAKPRNQPDDVNDPDFLPEVQKMIVKTIEYRADDHEFEIISTLVLWKKFIERRTDQSFLKLVKQSIWTVLKFPARLMQRMAIKRKPYHRPIDLHRQYKKHFREFSSLNPALVISTAPPPAIHAVASEFISTYSIPWIADFRDDVMEQMSMSWIKKFVSEKKLMQQETELLEKALFYTAVSTTDAHNISRRNKINVKVVQNAYDNELYPNGEERRGIKKFIMSYTGVVVHPQDIDTIFEALDDLVENEEINKDNFKFNIYGSTYQKVLHKIQNRNCKQIVNVYKNIPRKESLAKLTQSDALLHLSNGVGIGVLTGKIFEYLGAKRTIIDFPGDFDCSDALLKETNAGIVCRNKEEIKNTLKNLISEWEETGKVGYRGNKHVIEQHSWESRIKKLHRIIQEVLNH